MATKKIKIPLDLVSLQEEGYHLFILAKIGAHDVRLLIDTGASKTVIDKNFIAEKFPSLKLEANEQPTTGVGSNTIQSEFTDVADLKIGDLPLLSYKV